MAGAFKKDVFLRPGEFYFGEGEMQIRTILGSCVSITMWHMRHKFGGMCHYMLANPRKMNPLHLDGRYAEDAMQLFLREINKRGTTPREYQIKMFGGGNMFPTLTKKEENNIGLRNLTIGQELLKAHGFHIHSTHLGGVGYRRLVFSLTSGEVWLYHNVGDNRKDGTIL